jgi:hypothetical protein
MLQRKLLKELHHHEHSSVYASRAKQCIEGGVSIINNFQSPVDVQHDSVYSAAGPMQCFVCVMSSWLSVQNYPGRGELAAKILDRSKDGCEQWTIAFFFLRSTYG